MAIINALPENLQALFAPRSPLPYLPSIERKKLPPYTGIASYTDLFEDPNASSDRNDDDYLHVLTREQKIRRKENMRAFKQETNIKEQEEQCIYHQNNNHLFFFLIFFFILNVSSCYQGIPNKRKKEILFIRYLWHVL